MVSDAGSSSRCFFSRFETFWALTLHGYVFGGCQCIFALAYHSLSLRLRPRCTRAAAGDWGTLDPGWYRGGHGHILSG